MTSAYLKYVAFNMNKTRNSFELAMCIYEKVIAKAEKVHGKKIK